ncbi:MAG: ROK family protein [Alistipes sp.]|nr:ROK family protein [Alistipes sp.]
MRTLETSQQIVVTLDAGGTNFVFGAMSEGKPLGQSITKPSQAHDLDLCLSTLVAGFEEIIASLPEPPIAISFAFPGPADYRNGIIGGYLPNFPSFRDGVALGPMLEERFNIPVYINNDADLFAYGEAQGGALPRINKMLEEAGSEKRYRNLLGYTFGTGFGFGFVMDGKLNLGDNSCVETFCLKHRDHAKYIVEDGVAIRAVKRVYRELSGDDRDLQPKEIFDIAEGTAEGNTEAAKESFATLGRVAGDAMATAATLMDGIIVIGGGLTGASKYFMPALLEEMRTEIETMSGDKLRRVQMEVYNLDDKAEFEAFARGNSTKIKVYGSDREVVYDPIKRIGVTLSDIGASNAVSLGAYLYAVRNRTNEQN